VNTKYSLKLYPCFFDWQSLAALALLGFAGFIYRKNKSDIQNIYRCLVILTNSVNREVTHPDNKGEKNNHD